jgi:phospholipid/cholesterol/gamma-HCH transport system permease protein
MVQREAGAPGLHAHGEGSERRVVALSGRLDAAGVACLWCTALAAVERNPVRELWIDASGLVYCDSTGARFLIELCRRSAAQSCEIRGLPEAMRALVEMVTPVEPAPAVVRPDRGPIAALGRRSVERLGGLRELVVFTGELCWMLARSLRHPRQQLRMADALRVAERAGIGATPIVVLIGLLLGLILAFQSAVSLRRFGAEVFLADLLGIALLRELGPLMAAIVLAARSGSAFAAEIGTMKVNEEVDALTTLGLEPVRFLVVPRVLAALAVVPALTVLMTLAGLMGGAIVYATLDFPIATYVSRIQDATAPADFVGGVVKAAVFGVLVAGIGCLRGLQTAGSADAVGLSTTSAVVSAIVLIALADGAFALVFYTLGI